jgi:hemoglobin/transferrin/lactoferrin receptor protein
MNACTCWSRTAAIAIRSLAAIWIALIVPGAAAAQTLAPAAGQQPTADTKPNATKEDDAEKLRQFLDAVTVSATLNPESLKDTPSTVSVIDAQTIDRRLIQNTADLIKFEPGVYIDSNLTRAGLNGFNIRGIGGNRVMTLVDGVETAEQFDFGPFNMHQVPFDLDVLKSAEIVRSAGSSLYGSDALGGVVSFFTKDPSDYLGDRALHIGGKTLFDGRASDTSGNVVVAGGRGRVQASLFGSYASGHEQSNKGTRETEDVTRTAPNPQDRRGAQALGKMVATFAPGNVLRGSIEVADSEVDTEAFASRTRTAAGPTVTDVTDIDALDTLQRTRVSVDHRIDNVIGLQQLAWSAYAQDSTTDQVVDEVRTTTGAGVRTTILRNGTMAYEQQGFGGAVQGRKLAMPGGRALLFTFGGAYKHNTFDMLRDRLDINQATGAVVPNTGLILPTKYFPKSDVGEAGAYVQAEMRFGRVTLVPGVRYDRFSMDGDETDQIFLDSLSPVPADFDADAVSSRIGAAVRVTDQVTIVSQYAGGFRAPPYSAINSGFTNLAGGYTSQPNPNLDAETSDNVELGVRTAIGRMSLGVTGFVNFYDGFIQQVALGVNPATRLLEYQYQNIAQVTISGLELRGEYGLTDTLRLRASYARIRGNDVTGATDVPLDSVAPDQGVVGLEYAAPSRRWGAEALVRAVASQPASRLASATAFSPARYAVGDLVGWVRLAPRVTLRGAVLNVTDATYFDWSNVRGRMATDTTIDRYTNPGISGVLAVSYGW